MLTALLRYLAYGLSVGLASGFITGWFAKRRNWATKTVLSRAVWVFLGLYTGLVFVLEFGFHVLVYPKLDRQAGAVFMVARYLLILVFAELSRGVARRVAEGPGSGNLGQTETLQNRG